MRTLRYRAVDQAGRRVGGRLQAAGPRELEARLGQDGLELLSWRECRGVRRGRAARVRREDLIELVFHLEQLLRAGLPLLETLADLCESLEHRGLREVCAALAAQVEGGRSLSQAMEGFPAVFDPITVGLVRAGERSGRLVEVLRELLETLRWQQEQLARGRRLLVYPALVLVLVGGLLAFLVTFLVPELVGFVRTLGGELPWHTRALLAFTGAVREGWPLGLGLLGLLLAGPALAGRCSPTLARRLDAWRLRLPLLGALRRKTLLARFTGQFATMYGAGLTVLECIAAGEQLIDNLALREALREAGRRIAGGARISAGFEAAGLFPPLVVRMLRVGETTGALDEALRNASALHTREVRDAVERLQGLVGPALTLVLGALLGWIMLSVLGPIYGLVGQIQP